MKLWLFTLLGILLLIWLAGSALLFVDQAEYVYVTQFGKHVASYDGENEAGLHFKLPWPFQSALRLDRRLQTLDVPTQELIIRDYDEPTKSYKQLQMTFDVYVCWRIAKKSPEVDPLDQFVRSFGTVERAQAYLRSEAVSRMKIALSGLLMTQLVNIDEDQLQAGERMLRLRESLAEPAAKFGIEVVDVRLRRFNQPIQVRGSFFEKIRKERDREANVYRNQADELERTILAEGETEAGRILADAKATSERLGGQAEVESIVILNEAYREAPELYQFIRMLASYKQMFGDDKTQLVISLDHPLLSLFKDQPWLNGGMLKPLGPATTPGPGNGSPSEKEE